MRRKLTAVLASLVLLLLFPRLAQAQTVAAAATPDNLTAPSGLLGNMGGLRPLMGAYGLSFSASEVSEVLGNLTGGVQRGAAYDGVTTLALQLDTSVSLGWQGGLFNVSALQIHGRNLSAQNLLNLQTASGIEAERDTRLWELWYQQSLIKDHLDLKIGQQSLDQEFFTSANSALFLNTVMGWPMIPSADLYAGGPAYPLASPGLRLRGQSGAFTALAGVFDDNPGGGRRFSDDGQAINSGGTRFNLGTGALAIAELQYAKPGLPGTYRLGFWYDTASFPDQRYDASGRSLADPASSGIARSDRGNYSVYGVVDQVIWQPDADQPQALSVFARLMGAPGDRNLVDFSSNGGVTLKAPAASRPDDIVGLGYGVAKVSGAAAGLDRDTVFFTGAATPVRATETFVELTYQAVLTPWLLLQPDFQYIFLPGGGLANPRGNGTDRIGNEAVLGVRTTVTF